MELLAERRSAFAFRLLSSSPARWHATRHAPTLELTHDTAAERIIAIGRLTLCVYWLLAFFLDRAWSSRFHDAITWMICGYSAYALVRVAVAWRASYTLLLWRYARHAADLLFFGVLAFLTDGSNSPFFMGFVFSLVCAAVLFRTSGVAWTAALATAIYVLVTILAGDLEFTAHRFFLRTGALAAIAVLLIQLKAHHERVLTEYRKLADWPRGMTVGRSGMLTEILQEARDILRVPRVMVIWQDEEQECLRIASLSDSGIKFADEPASAFDSVVDASTRMKSFVATSRMRTAVARSTKTSEEFLPLPSHPIHPAFRERFQIDHVVASPFSGQAISGWVFALDRKNITLDELLLTEVVTSLVEGRMEQFHLSELVRKQTLIDERQRCARDLHDGILQSLSGTALHLQCLSHLIERDPVAALYSLAEVQQTLANDQREVRQFVMRLRSAAAPDDEPQLAGRLASLADRIQRQWGLKVIIDTTPLIEMIAAPMAEEIHRVIKEAVTNAAIHSNASRVRVEVYASSERARIVVEDNGRGFAFKGRYDLPTLIDSRRGPVTLKERVRALGGSMIIESEETGAHIEIELPIAEVPAT